MVSPPAAIALVRGRPVQAAAADCEVRGIQHRNATPLGLSRDGRRVMIYNGVTRATRIARLSPETSIRIEVVGTIKGPVGHLPTIGDLLP